MPTLQRGVRSQRVLKRRTYESTEKMGAEKNTKTDILTGYAYTPKRGEVAARLKTTYVRKHRKNRAQSENTERTEREEPRHANGRMRSRFLLRCLLADHRGKSRYSHRGYIKASLDALGLRFEIAHGLGLIINGVAIIVDELAVGSRLKRS